MKTSKRKEESQGTSNKNEIQTKRRKVQTDLDNFLEPVIAFILKAGIQKLRLQIFENQLKKFGGTLSNDFSSAVTHLIVDDNMEMVKICRILKLDLPPHDVIIVKTSWLSACFKEKKLVETKDYILDIPSSFSKKPVEEDEVYDSKAEGDIPVNPNEAEINLPKVGIMYGHHRKTGKTSEAASSDSDYDQSDGEAGTSNLSDTETSTPSTSNTSAKFLKKGNWICAQSSKVELVNHNKHITDKLEEMVKTYKSTNDTWRAFGYQKAIQVLRRQAKPISSFEEALALPGVGKRLAEKIWEIAESGQLRKLNEFKANDDIKIIEMFTNVWGAGATTARTWYQQGLRSLDDLKEKANLTYQQKIGLRLYDDILDRMPRAEAGEIEQVVRVAAESILEGVIVQACGSYRRGKTTCGDIDVLMTHPDGKSHKGLFGKVLAKLKEDGTLYYASAVEIFVSKNKKLPRDMSQAFNYLKTLEAKTHMI